MATQQTRVTPSRSATSFSRWMIPLGAVPIHICIGSVYAWSTFNRPIKALFPNDPSWFSPPYTTFSTALVLLGLSAAFGGTWVERRGPRAAATAAAILFGSGLVLGGIGLALRQSWLVFLGMGVVAGMGCGLGYIAPVSTLVKWFPDRRGMATGMAIMGFGGAFLAGYLNCGVLSAQNEEHGVRNVVLVHGAWADGSGWKGVYEILVKDGYNVSIVQEPETSFQEDVAATKRVLALQDGPCILVAHSYGGAVITEAGTDPSVAGLVYIAAHMPDAGENESDDGKRFPSDLSKSNAIKKTADGFTYLDPAQFHEFFAADLTTEQAAFMARSQVLNKAENFRAVITTAAWKTKPTWMLVAGSDRTISPDLERWYAERAKSHMVEVSGASHAVYVSRPKEVAALIEEAASHAR